MNLSLYQPPLAAILRGLAVDEAADCARVLLDAGFRIIEVPLNRPGALACIERIARIAPADALVGGGTLLAVDDVDAVHRAGGRLMVAPNFDAAVVGRARALGMVTAPGIATPTEAFAALAAGADVLKLFPAEVIGPRGLAALRSVLPDDVPVWPVGGISPDSLAAWRAAGASGFGIGSALYRPGIDPATLAARARAFVDAWGARA